MDLKPKAYVEAYFAHQPIFNENGKVWGYKLLYRHAPDAEAALFSDEGQATMEVMANLALCPDESFKPANILLSFSRHSLLAGVPLSLQPELTVVEILDPEPLDDALLNQILLLKKQGFSISVKNYQAREENEKLYDVADILTIDIGVVPLEEAVGLIKRGGNGDRDFLAEKVETRVQFEQAREVGFSLFQGFFFKRPKTNIVRKITASEALKFKLLEQLNRPDEDFISLSETIKQDVSLSLRLLRLLNSPAYRFAATMTSVKQAAVYLGLSQLKQWLRVVLLTDMKQPELSLELTRTSLHRAKFLELLSEPGAMPQKSERLFLLGLFSLLDAMLDIPMVEIVEMLSSLEGSITATLMGKETEYRPWMQLVESVEKSDWDMTGRMAAVLQLKTSNILKYYITASEWSNTVLVHV